MHSNYQEKKAKILIAIHTINNYFGFAYKNINLENNKEKFFVKKFDRDLSNNLILEFSRFIPNQALFSIERISVSNGPTNFNASRLILVLARVLSQQLSCSLDTYSSFQIMSKRIARKNNLIDNNSYFWIINKLKKKGYIAGKYKIYRNKNEESDFFIDEVISPKMIYSLSSKNKYFATDLDVQDDLRELMKYSSINHKKSIFKSWEKALPIYPLSAAN